MHLPDFLPIPAKTRNFRDRIGFILIDLRRPSPRTDWQKVQREVWKLEKQLSKYLSEGTPPDRNSPLSSHLRADKQALQLGVSRG
jgi:hypothetical protein